MSNGKWTLVLGNFGDVPGDGFELISTTEISQHDTRDEAWEELIFRAYTYPWEAYDLMIDKPEFGPCEAGWPTLKDDCPEEWRDRYMTALETCAKRAKEQLQF